VSNYDDNVYVVWQAQDPAGTDEDIFFVESDDEGVNFSMQKDISGNTGDSFDPGVMTSGDKVIVTWRDFTTPTGAGAEIFYAQGE
jgi:hypothetical protein